MSFKTKRVKCYKEGFKQEVVSQVMGGLLSKSAAASKYGVSWMSVDRWCRSYGVSGVEYVGLPPQTAKTPPRPEEPQILLLKIIRDKALKFA